MSRPCRYHRSIRKTLRGRLGRGHHGRRTANRTIRAITKACPDCRKENR